MAIAGAKPKEDRSQIRHRNPIAEGTEWRDVVAVPFDGPELGDRPQPGVSLDRPRYVPDDAGWPEATERWWEAVRTMPHAILWDLAEWETARAAAEAHARFVEGWKGCASGSELRQREKQLGMTHDARRDLRIRYIPVKTKPAAGTGDALPANVARLDDFRDL